MRKIAKYGWIKQLPDFRDYQFTVSEKVLKALPPKTDLRPTCPPVVDQGQLGSCTANAIAGAHRFDQIKQKEKVQFLLSKQGGGVGYAPSPASSGSRSF